MHTFYNIGKKLVNKSEKGTAYTLFYKNTYYKKWYRGLNLLKLKKYFKDKPEAEILKRIQKKYMFVTKPHKILRKLP